MRKILTVLTMIIVLLLCVITEAATSGYKGTSTMRVRTKANWYTGGQESITLASNALSKGAGARGIYKVYLDGRFVGTIGNPNSGKRDHDWGVLTVNLKRNKTHTIKVVYDESATRKCYKRKSGRNMSRNIRPYWHVSKTHKVEWYR